MKKEVYGNHRQEEVNVFIQNLKHYLQDLDEIKSWNLDIGNAILDRGPSKNGYYPIDFTYKSIIRNKCGEPKAFLLCSNPAGKDLVFRNVNQARKIKNLLSDAINPAVAVPFCDGYFEGISWALYDLYRPLSDKKLHWIFQRTVLTPIIIEWLNMILLESKRKIPSNKISNTIINPLLALENTSDIPDNIRRKAAETIDRLVQGHWQPYLTMAHNDLWKGNILLPTLKTNQSVKFMITDWAGSNLQGMPFYDLLKFSMSFKVPKFYCKLITKHQCEILNCEYEDSISYLITSLAIHGQNLDQFPRHAYIRLSKRLFSFYQSYIV